MWIKGKPWAPNVQMADQRIIVSRLWALSLLITLLLTCNFHYLHCTDQHIVVPRPPMMPIWEEITHLPKISHWKPEKNGMLLNSLMLRQQKKSCVLGIVKMISGHWTCMVCTEQKLFKYCRNIYIMLNPWSHQTAWQHLMQSTRNHPHCCLRLWSL